MTDAHQTPLTPDDLARFIAKHRIDAQIERMAMDTPTVLDAATALGVQPPPLAQIIKTLLFLIKEEPVLMIACGDATVDRRPLADRFGVGKKQVKLADAQTVLRITGYPVGGVPPFGHVTPCTGLAR